MAATGVAPVRAVTAKPDGAAAHVSPCDIHTRWRPGRPASKPAAAASRGSSSASSVVAPYSAAPVRRTVPPRAWTMSWKP